MNKHQLFMRTILAIVFITSACSAHAHPVGSAGMKAAVVTEQLKNSNLYFTENKGQVAGIGREQILFTAHNSQAHIFLTPTSIQYQFSKQETVAGSGKTTWRFGVELLGANKHSHIIRREEGQLKEHFYLAHCPQGITGAATFGKLVYENIYPDIDWVIYGKGPNLEYDFVVKPGGDPRLIRLKVNDATAVYIDDAGELIMKTPLGEVREHAPLSFANGKKVESSFFKRPDGTIGFNIIPSATQTIVIDPFVEWATYFGGSTIDIIRNSATDAAGNVYASGWTNSTAAIAGAGHQTIYGGGTYDAFIVKFDAAGNRKWATYYGGTGTDYGYSCAATANGDAVYLAGVTSSSTAGAIATAGAHQATTAGGNEGYLVRFDSTGVRQWGTYYGGSGSDNLYSCAVDGAGSVYIAGYTASAAGIASTGAFQTALSGANDAFIAKFNPAGVRQWGTYFGGTQEDRGFTCTASGNNIYLTGFTASTTGIATAGVYQSTYGTGSYDMFVTQFDTSGTRKWATYYGSTGSDYCYGAAAFDSGIYISGYTSSSSNTLTTPGAYQTTSGGSFEAVLARLDTTGNRVWGTFFGGPGADITYGCSLNPQGHIFLSGFTASLSGIAADGVQNTLNGACDAYVAKFTPDGQRIWSSYFGGPGNDSTYSVAAGNGVVYIPGFTGSATGIATGNAYQATIGGGNTDGFIARISDPVLTLNHITATSYCAGNTIAVPYTSAGSFMPSNTFTAQLSDASGSFTSPVAIGVSTNASGTINATIPATTVSGANYRIRIVAASPVVITNDNGSGLVINTVPSTPGPVIGSNNVCNGATEVYRATAVTNTSSYTWTLPTGWTGTSNADTIQLITGPNAGNITVTANNTCGSSVPATLAVSISALVVPGAIVSADDSVICAGTPVTFNAVPVNGGTAPVYQWMKNGVNVGANSTSYTDAALNNQDTVYVVITSNSLCVSTPTATSNKKVTRVNPIDNPSVTVAANPGTTVPANQTITFTANALNAGTAPVYQWYVSGSAIAGATNNTFTVTGLADGDVVSVKVRRGGMATTLCSNIDSVTSTALIIHIVLDVAAVPGTGSFVLYPNPTAGKLTLAGTNGSGKACALELYSAIGKMISNESFNTTAGVWKKDIRLQDNLPNGLYYLRLRTDNQQKTLTFFLTR